MKSTASVSRCGATFDEYVSSSSSVLLGRYKPSTRTSTTTRTIFSERGEEESQRWQASKWQDLSIGLRGLAQTLRQPGSQ